MQGTVKFMEFPSTDIDRAQRFWHGVIGWEFGSGLAEHFDYRMAPTGPDTGVALTPGDHPGHPNVYIKTDELDAALAKVQELGGEAGDARDIPERLTAEIPSLGLHGRIADCKDSEGNAFCLWQPDASRL